MVVSASNIFQKVLSIASSLKAEFSAFATGLSCSVRAQFVHQCQECEKKELAFSRVIAFSSSSSAPIFFGFPFFVRLLLSLFGTPAACGRGRGRRHLAMIPFLIGSKFLH